MDKPIMITGIFAILAIIGIVLFVNNATISGRVISINADDFYVRPTGMQMRVESGVMVLQSETPINSVCKNAIFCNGERSYTCCNHEGTSCILPSNDDANKGSCPLTHRSRCQCREDYIAGLVEKYG